MKKKRYGQGIKIISGIMLIISAIVFLAGVVLNYIFFSEGFFESTKEEVIENYFDSELESDGHLVMHFGICDYLEYGVPDYSGLDQYKNRNIQFTLYDNGKAYYTNVTKKMQRQETAVEPSDTNPYLNNAQGYIVLPVKDITEEEIDYWSGWQSFFGKDAKEYSEAYIKNWEAENEIEENTHIYMVEVSVLPELPYHDSYYRMYAFLSYGYDFRYLVVAAAPAAFLLALLLFIFLMKSAGHRKETDEIVLRAVDRIPTDLFLAGSFFVCAILLSVVAEISPWQIMGIALGGFFGTIGMIFGLLVCMSIAVRIKTKTFWKSMVCYKILRFAIDKLGYIFNHLSLVKKGILVLAGIIFLEFFIIVAFYEAGVILMFWFLEKLVFIPFVLIVLINMKQIKEGTHAMTEGKIDCKFETNRMLPVFKEHVADIEQLKAGLNIAVEERIKSERFKTELITNVSHDIKTPLTSIINYVGLIENEEVEDEKLKSYIDVLKRQSLRLKKLIEDLIEASKASTGNVKVNLEKCEVDVLLTQTIGEFEEKLKESNLDFQLKKEVENVSILADGRHLWRIFDNLLNNIYKYAQPGTRVYLNLERENGKAVIIFRNTSKYPLNISSEELMQRFVRGDASRNTEGTGLGLSIAKNLTELMGGSFKLDVDGDLFKVTLIFDEADVQENILKN